MIVMFEIAVIGLFAPRLGVVRQCVECRATAGPDAPDCPGFGPGCIAPPSRQAQELIAINR